MKKFELTVIEILFNSQRDYIGTVYCETTTDVLYLKPPLEGSYTVMLDPETGLPLTYSVWKEKYS